MPAGWGEEERFAAAVERGTTPVGDDGADFARELEVAGLLCAAGPALGPTPAARARAKQRLMAAFAEQHAPGPAEQTGPLPVAVVEAPAPLRRREGGRHAAPEPDTSVTPAEPAPGPTVHQLSRVRPERRNRRAALLGAAAAAALVALAGTGTFASRDALPGDTLYGVKRVAESTGYALTFGEQAKARRHLEQAQRRLDEVEGIVGRDQVARTSGAPVDPTEQERVRTTMREFDDSATEGSRLLLAGAAPDAAQVDDVRQWATEQSTRLSELRSAIPAQDKADESLALLDRLLGEADALQNVPCDPSAGPCPTVPDATQADDLPAGDTTTLPEGVPPGAAESRTTARGGDRSGDTADEPADDTGRDASTDDDSDEGSSDDRRGGGSGGGDAGGQVDVPLPLPAPVKVPSILPGVPGVSLG